MLDIVIIINNRGGWTGLKKQLSTIEKIDPLWDLQGQHVFRVYVIHSNCVRLHNFFFFKMDYGENCYLH